MPSVRLSRLPAPALCLGAEIAPRANLPFRVRGPLFSQATAKRPAVMRRQAPSLQTPAVNYTPLYLRVRMEKKANGIDGSGGGIKRRPAGRSATCDARVTACSSRHRLMARAISERNEKLCFIHTSRQKTAYALATLISTGPRIPRNCGSWRHLN